MAPEVSEPIRRSDVVLWMALSSCVFHILEEYSFSWVGWAVSVGLPVDWLAYFVANVSFLTLGVAGAIIGWRFPSFSLAFPALLLLNGVFHVAATVYSRWPNPGTFTAVLLMAPASISCFRQAHRDGQLTGRVMARAFCLGAAVHSYPAILILLRPFMSY